MVARYNVASRIPIINPDDIAWEIRPNHNGEIIAIDRSVRAKRVESSFPERVRSGNMENKSVEYEKQYLLYMDILGFSCAIKNPDDHEIYNRSPDFFKYSLDCMRDIPKPLSKDYVIGEKLRLQMFSDCITMSFPVENIDKNLYGLGEFLMKICHLQRKLLANLFPTRGSVVKGDLYNDGSIIFGPALIEAVELEKTAKFPKVIFSKDVINDINIGCLECGRNSPFSLFLEKEEEEDGTKYINFFKNYPKWHKGEKEKIEKVIKSGLDPKRNSEDVRKKYKWLETKYNQAEEERLAVENQKL